MVNIKNATIDSVLRDYFYCVDSTKLLDDNIDIDTENHVENSCQKYLVLFAEFLNKARFNGYAIHPSILKRLMDIIEYEGYEYLIMQQYVNILENAMIITEDGVLPIDAIHEFTPEEARDFVTSYLEVMQSTDISTGTIKSVNILHWDPDNTGVPENLYILGEEQYPIDRIFKSMGTLKDPVQYAEFAYVLYTNNKSAYKYLLDTWRVYLEYVFFLLDNDDNESLDILTKNITSLSILAAYIDTYYTLISEGIKTLSEQANKNARRLIEVITINITIEQTAMIIGKNYEFWKEYDVNNPSSLQTLSTAIALYESNIDRFSILDPIQYINKIGQVYPDDAYYYARNCILDMDYKIFCYNILNIWESLKDFIDSETLENIMLECVDGIIKLDDSDLDMALYELMDKTKDCDYLQNVYQMVLTEYNREPIEEDKSTI